MKSNKNYLTPAPKDFIWPRCPEADRFIEDELAVFLRQNCFANGLAEHMMKETSTRFSAWVDHLLLSTRGYDTSMLGRLGFCEDKNAKRPPGTRVFFHPYADLPKILLSSRTKAVGCAIVVEDLWKFLMTHKVSTSIEGAPYATYRRARLTEGPSEFFAVERRGAQDFVPDFRDRSERYVQAFERWAMRRRRFESDTDGMRETLKLAKQLARELGTGPASHIFLEGERIYWQSMNRAGQIQKARQDILGLGWANHDHHTFRSSRAQFAALIDILLAFGFKIRERYYAGGQAGWGAQIMEQPESGTVIFADVDLAPSEVVVDFTRSKLPNLEKPRTVGLWCALHGESMLEAGMHHLEAKFDYERLKEDLKAENVETMPPFSDFPFLRQAFTKAELWPVRIERLETLRAEGKISNEAFEQFRAHGAVGSHLENLQRREGFKGFNQRGVSDIITAVNPERQALSARTEKKSE